MNRPKDPTIDQGIRNSAELTRFVTVMGRIRNAASPTEKRSELNGYFESLDERDGACVCWLLGGGVASSAPLSKRELRRFVLETTGLSNWMWDRCRVETDGMVELAAKLLPGIPDDGANSDQGSLVNTVASILGNSRGSPRDIFDFIWKRWDRVEREFLFNLSLGPVHWNVDFSIVAEAAKRWTNVPEWLLHRRILQLNPARDGNWGNLFRSASTEEGALAPTAFVTWEVWDGSLESLGSVETWTAEWVFGGRDLQVVRRAGAVGIWSRDGWVQGNEFDELWEWANGLNRDVVIHGEWVPGTGDRARGKGELAAEELTVSKSPYLSISEIHDCSGVDLLRAHDCTVNFGDANREILDLIRGGRKSVQAEFFAGSVDQSSEKGPVRLRDRIRAANWHELGQRLERGIPDAIGLLLRPRNRFEAGEEFRSRGVLLPRPTKRCRLLLVSVRTIPGGGQGAEMEGDFAVREGTNWVSVLRTRFCLEGADWERFSNFVAANSTGRFGPVRILRPGLVGEVEFREVTLRRGRKLGARWGGIRRTNLRWDLDQTHCLTLEQLRVISI